MAKQIVVTSTSHLPRMAAGTAFLGTKAFPPEHFSAEQLKAIIGDRLLTVVVGEVLTADMVDAFVAAHAPAAETKAAKAK